MHGPVQARGDGVAYARRYAIWNRELETIVGLSELNDAKTIKDVDAAMDDVSWNENVIATDSRGRIGYWHPGLHQLRPRRWDERLPYPGDGRAEWHGLLAPDERPQVVNPKRGWVANWNNPPSAGLDQRRRTGSRAPRRRPAPDPPPAAARQEGGEEPELRHAAARSS